MRYYLSLVRPRAFSRPSERFPAFSPRPNYDLETAELLRSPILLKQFTSMSSTGGSSYLMAKRGAQMHSPQLIALCLPAAAAAAATATTTLGTLLTRTRLVYLDGTLMELDPVDCIDRGARSAFV